MSRLLIFGAALLCSCTSPFSVSAGFFGANVTVAFPNGVSGTVPVSASPSASSPALLVPVGTKPSDTATVVSGSTTPATVPVIESEVSSPVLSVPANKIVL